MYKEPIFGILGVIGVIEIAWCLGNVSVSS